MSKLRELREQKNMSKTELAAAIKVTAQTIDKWENSIDLSNMKVKHWFALCDLFNLDHKFFCL